LNDAIHKSLFFCFEEKRRAEKRREEKRREEKRREEKRREEKRREEKSREREERRKWWLEQLAMKEKEEHVVWNSEIR